MPGCMREVLSLTKIRNGERKWIKPPLRAASVAERKGTTSDAAPCKASHRGQGEGTPWLSCCSACFRPHGFFSILAYMNLPMKFPTDLNLYSEGGKMVLSTVCVSHLGRTVEKGKKKTFIFMSWRLGNEQEGKAKDGKDCKRLANVQASTVQADIYPETSITPLLGRLKMVLEIQSN